MLFHFHLPYITLLICIGNLTVNYVRTVTHPGLTLVFHRHDKSNNLLEKGIFNFT